MVDIHFFKVMASGGLYLNATTLDEKNNIIDFGWLGCSKYYLVKYLSGCLVVSFFLPGVNIFL